MEKLYNGVVLPDEWPPAKLPFRVDGNKILPEEPPYLVSPPAVIDVTVGRQLFVDSFLIETSELPFAYHRAVKYGGNPVFKAEKPWEKPEDGLPCACPLSGGIVYDRAENIYKMWYTAGWFGHLCYATSFDGIHWERPELDVVPGTNIVLPYESWRRTDDAWHPEFQCPDTTTVIVDPDSGPETKYKMLVRTPGMKLAGTVMTSPDGIHWGDFRPTGPTYDKSTIFYNPFRRKWVQSIRTIWDPREALGLVEKGKTVRTRSYHEASDFYEAAKWEDETKLKWMCADSLDLPDTDPYVHDFEPQLYNLDAVAYESIMLGMFQRMLGPENNFTVETGTPKITELIPIYSRDGWHWSRPNREALIAPTRQAGSWERGYVESVGGVCTVSDDEIRIYYAAFAGDPTRTLATTGGWDHTGAYANGATGFAVLRRDGFVSLSAQKRTGKVLTRRLTFSEGEELYVNAEKSVLSVKILSSDGQLLAGSGLQSIDATAAKIHFDSFDPASLKGKTFRLCFELEKGELYAFWFAKDAAGSSGGFLP